MLQRRGQTYSSRVTVPAELRATIGRAEIVRSLRTGDPREATHRLALWETFLGTYFATVRTRGRAMTREQIDEITRRYLEATFDEIEERLALDWSDTGAGRDQHQWNLQEEGERLVALLAHAELAEFLEEARALLPETDESMQRRLARRLIEAKVQGIRAELGAWNGQPLARPEELSPSAPPKEAPKETPKVSVVAKDYGDERKAGGFWTAKTELQNRTIFALLADLLGDPPIGDVTKEAIRQLGADVVQLPSNMTKRFPGVAPREVLRRLEGDTKTPRLEPRSINKYRQLTRSLFKWATEHDYISTNPAAVLRDVKEGKARLDRKEFTDDDLRVYFAALPQTAEPEPFLYWIPRVLAYTGMRLGEAAKLQRQDVRQENGLWLFDVNEEGEGKRLKTEASRRLVPMHPRLVELGLPEFVQGCPEGFLWPADIRTTANPTRGDMDKLSKLLGRKLRAAGITDPKKTGAHSFRHTVTKRLKSESVPEYQIADLIGHEDDSMTTGRYGKATDVVRLAAVVRLLQLPV